MIIAILEFNDENIGVNQETTKFSKIKSLEN